MAAAMCRSCTRRRNGANALNLEDLAPRVREFSPTALRNFSRSALVQRAAAATFRSADAARGIAAVSIGRAERHGGPVTFANRSAPGGPQEGAQEQQRRRGR